MNTNTDSYELKSLRRNNESKHTMAKTTKKKKTKNETDVFLNIHICVLSNKISIKACI